MNKRREHFICTTEVNESAYSAYIKATGLEKNSISFPLVHENKDADNGRVTIVVFVVVVVDDDDDDVDDDDEYGLFISKYIQ